jgi:hypothetical protein
MASDDQIHCIIYRKRMNVPLELDFNMTFSEAIGMSVNLWQSMTRVCIVSLVNLHASSNFKTSLLSWKPNRKGFIYYVLICSSYIIGFIAPILSSEG